MRKIIDFFIRIYSRDVFLAYLVKRRRLDWIFSTDIGPFPLRGDVKYDGIYWRIKSVNPERKGISVCLSRGRRKRARRLFIPYSGISQIYYR